VSGQLVVVEKNSGPKLGFAVRNSTELVLDGGVALDLAQFERDFDVSLDISTNEFGFLVSGVSRRYVAQIAIPARRYATVADGVGDDGAPRMKQVAEPFDIGRVVLTLWAKEGASHE